MPLSLIRPACLLAPLLAGPLAFGAWEEAQCKKVVNLSRRTLVLVLWSIDPWAKAAGSRLEAGPGQGDMVPLEPLATAGADAVPTRLPLGHGESVLVYLDKPDTAAQASATFRLQDQDGKSFVSFKFDANWDGGASRLEPLPETGQTRERPKCDGDTYVLQEPAKPPRKALGDLTPAALESKVDNSNAKPATARPGSARSGTDIRKDKENFLIGTIVNQSGGPLTLFPYRKGMIVIPAQTGPAETRQTEDPRTFVIRDGETVQVAQPLTASTGDGSYLLLDAAAATRIHLAWNGPRLEAIQPKVVPDLLRGAKDGRNQVRAEADQIIIGGSGAAPETGPAVEAKQQVEPAREQTSGAAAWVRPRAN